MQSFCTALQMSPVADVESPPGPEPPCGRAPIPPYPSVNESAVVESWSKPIFGGNWKPPDCTGWSETGFTTLVSIAARFASTSDASAMLRHVGAISELPGLSYWSTTHKRWQTLILEAYAVTDPQSGTRRKDFTPDELEAGKAVYFEQVDNLSGKAIYRLHIDECSGDRIVFDIENVSTMHYHFIPIFHPGEMQSIYFLDRGSDSSWRYYSLMRTGKSVNRLIAGNQSSAINRAVALYRQIVGIPSAQEPPAAR